jgi:hypothetical protein
MQYYQLYENNEEEKITAHVIVFDDGQTVVKWCGNVQSLVIHKNLDEFKTISVRDGRTLIQTY